MFKVLSPDLKGFILIDIARNGMNIKTSKVEIADITKPYLYFRPFNRLFI